MSDADETRIPLGRRLVYAAVVVVVAVASLEGVGRLAGPAESLLLVPFDGQAPHDLTQYFEDDPELFWRMRPSLDVEPSYWADRTDALGLRNRETAGEKDGRTRVLCLGDSCTYGLGVSVDDAWPARLGVLSPDHEVVNAGIAGYSSFQGRVLAEEVAPLLDPDVVIACFGFNDARAWGTPQDGRYLCLSDVERVEHLRYLTWTRRSGLVRLAMSWVDVPEPERVAGGDAASLDLVARPRVSPDEFAANLEAILAVAPRKLVLIWARRVELDPTFRDTRPVERFAEYQRVALEVAERVGAGVVDLRAVLREAGEPPSALYIDNVHAGALGSQVVARAVREALLR